MAGGRVYPQSAIDEICDRAHERGIPVHMDGARVFNAAAAAGRPVSEIVAKVDTVMFCLSKALGAPAGSMLAGSHRLIDKGRLLRKRLGGGMRQAGILAAAGLIALEDSLKGLPLDHANAQYIADSLRAIKGISVFPVETNIVIFDVSNTGRTPRDISLALKARGVLMNGFTDKLMRAVTHYDVNREQCVLAVSALRDAMAPC
jgi:threonine aldolase